MLYITTMKYLNLTDEIQPDSTMIVFCKGNETVKVTELKSILAAAVDSRLHIEFEPADGKDDMLMRTGELLAAVDEAVFLDPSMTVPKRYAGKVTAAKKKSSAKRKRTSRAKAVAAAPVKPAEKEPDATVGDPEKTAEQKHSEASKKAEKPKMEKQESSSEEDLSSMPSWRQKFEARKKAEQQKNN